MKFTVFLKSIDIFARDFNINVRGRVKSGTNFGGTVTILSFIVLFVYSVLLAMNIFTHEAVTKTQERVYHNLEEMVPINAKDMRFEVAFFPVD